MDTAHRSTTCVKVKGTQPKIKSLLLPVHEVKNGDRIQKPNDRDAGDHN